MNSIEAVSNIDGSHTLFNVTNVASKYNDEYKYRFTVLKNSEIKELRALNFQECNNAGVWSSSLPKGATRSLVEVATLNPKYEDGETLYANIREKFVSEPIAVADEVKNPMYDVPVYILLLTLLNGSYCKDICSGPTEVYTLYRKVDCIEVFSISHDRVMVTVNLDRNALDMTINTLPKDCIEYVMLKNIIDMCHNGFDITNWSLLIAVERYYHIADARNNLVVIESASFKYNRVVTNRILNLYKENNIIAYSDCSYKGDCSVFSCTRIDEEFLTVIFSIARDCEFNKARRAKQI